MFEAVIADPARRTPSRSVARRLAPWVLALALHLMVWVMALRAQPSLETWSARMAAEIHGALAAQAPTELTIAPAPPPPPEPPPEAEPPPEVEAPPPEPSPRPTDAPPPRRAAAPVKAAPPPAAAGQVLTSADAPVDFGDQAFVVGTASAYAGGVTKALGTGTTAGGRGATTPSAPPAPPKKSRSQSVRLEGSAWRCPWPSKALDADIYEQSVVLKVRVGSDGRARSVEVLEDPGLGFGDAARACAMKTRFTPALDREGDPVTATSPPIRVRFTR